MNMKPSTDEPSTDEPSTNLFTSPFKSLEYDVANSSPTKSPANSSRKRSRTETSTLEPDDTSLVLFVNINKLYINTSGVGRSVCFIDEDGDIRPCKVVKVNSLYKNELISNSQVEGFMPVKDICHFAHILVQGDSTTTKFVENPGFHVAVAMIQMSGIKGLPNNDGTKNALRTDVLRLQCLGINRIPLSFAPSQTGYEGGVWGKHWINEPDLKHVGMQFQKKPIFGNDAMPVDNGVKSKRYVSTATVIRSRLERIQAPPGAKCAGLTTDFMRMPPTYATSNYFEGVAAMVIDMEQEELMDERTEIIFPKVRATSAAFKKLEAHAKFSRQEIYMHQNPLVVATFIQCLGDGFPVDVVANMIFDEVYKTQGIKRTKDEEEGGLYPVHPFYKFTLSSSPETPSAPSFAQTPTKSNWIQWFLEHM